MLTWYNKTMCFFKILSTSVELHFYFTNLVLVLNAFLPSVCWDTNFIISNPGLLFGKKEWIGINDVQS